LDALSQQELASRLTLNCVSCYVEPQNVQVLSSDVTLMSVGSIHLLTRHLWQVTAGGSCLTCASKQLLILLKGV